MTRFLKLSMIAILAAVFIAPAASARPRVFIGGYFGPGFYGPYGYGYGPGWYGPYWGPYGYVATPPTGSVKIETKKMKNVKNDDVYVDGGFAGTVAQLGTFKLRPGEHDIQLRTPDGNPIYSEHINVIPGKTLKVTPTAPTAS